GKVIGPGRADTGRRPIRLVAKGGASGEGVAEASDVPEFDLPTTNLRTPPAGGRPYGSTRWSPETISKSNGGLSPWRSWRSGAGARDVGLRAARNVPGVLNITGGCTPVW
ncbi:MAG: hypothetical protein M3461_14785, partial [Pseudomonadota bacterium]|nr:hypothetical protein [Pseudomonadota bacterium]